MLETKVHLANELVACMKAQLNECDDQDFITHIIYSICRALRVSAKDLKSELRTTELAEARYILFFILVKQKKLTLAAAGRMVNRDHSSVLYGIKKYGDFVKNSDWSFLDKIHKVMEELSL